VAAVGRRWPRRPDPREREQRRERKRRGEGRRRGAAAAPVAGRPWRQRWLVGLLDVGGEKGILTLG